MCGVSGRGLRLWIGGLGAGDGLVWLGWRRVSCLLGRQAGRREQERHVSTYPSCFSCTAERTCPNKNPKAKPPPPPPPELRNRTVPQRRHRRLRSYAYNNRAYFSYKKKSHQRRTRKSEQNKTEGGRKEGRQEAKEVSSSPSTPHGKIHQHSVESCFIYIVYLVSFRPF